MTLNLELDMHHNTVLEELKSSWRKHIVNKICFGGFSFCYLEICNLVQSVSGVGSQRNDNQDSSKDADTEGVLIFWFLHFMS